MIERIGNEEGVEFAGREPEADAILVAQAAPAASPDQPVTDAAPAGSDTRLVVEVDEAGVLRLPATASVDQPRVNGTDLEFVQADGSVIVVPNGAIQGLTIFIGAVEIPPQTVAALFEANGIEAAAGPAGAGTRSSGGNFEVPVGGIGDAFDIGNLLDPTELRFGQPDFEDLYPANNRPTFGNGIFGPGAFGLNLSEEGLSFGLPDDAPIGSDTGDSAFFMIDLGARDPDGDPLLFTLGRPDLDLTSNGIPVIWEGVGTDHLIGRAGDQTVLDITIGGASGVVILRLMAPVDHPAQGEDVLQLGLTVTANDGRGGTATATLTVGIEDDSPIIGTPQPGIVDEDGLPLGVGDNADGDDQGGNAGEGRDETVFTGSLGISWGADRGDSADSLNEDGSFAQDVGGRAVYFSQTDFDAFAAAYSGLTSGGRALTYVLSANGTIITAYVAGGESELGESIFRISLSDDGAGAYKFQLLGKLDHVATEGGDKGEEGGSEGGFEFARLVEGPQGHGSYEDDINLTIGFTARDADGDTANGQIAITIDDDMPTISVEPTRGNVTHDETPWPQNPLWSYFGPAGDKNDNDVGIKASITAAADLFDSVSAKGDDPHVSSLEKLFFEGAIGYAQSTTSLVSVTVDFGADGAATSNALVYSFDLGREGYSGLFTSEGQEIRLSIENGIVVGRVDGGVDDGKAAIALSIDPETGKVTVAQWLSIQHGDTTSNDDVATMVENAVRVTVTATDGDHDTRSASADISGQIRFEDDGPTAVYGDRVVVRVDEDDIDSRWSQGTSPDDGGWHDGSVTINGGATSWGSASALVHFGADGPAVGGGFTLSANAISIFEAMGLESKGIDLAYSVEGNTLTAKASGHVVFEFTLDGDGDFSFRLYDQLDHARPAAGTADQNTLSIDFGKIIVATDRDGDSLTLGGKVSVAVKDDVPEISANGKTLTVIHDETRGINRDADDVWEIPRALANAIHGLSVIGAAESQLEASDLFSIKSGADDRAVVSYKLTNATGGSFNGVDSGLKTTDGNRTIFLKTDGDVIWGQTAAGTKVFAIYLDGNDEIYLVQFKAIAHDVDGSSQAAHDDLAVIKSLIHVQVSVTDFDGDTVRQVSHNAITIGFQDDGPSIDGFGTYRGAALVHDETPDRDYYSNDTTTGYAALFSTVAHQGQDDDVPPAGAGPIGYARISGSDMFWADVDYGTDGKDNASFAFSIGNAATALKTTEGKAITLFQQGDIIIGRFDSNGDDKVDGKDDAAFALHINAATGDMTLVQYVSLAHPTGGSSYNELVSLAANNVQVTLTVKDGDGDTASQTINIGDKIGFRDDGPSVDVDRASGQGHSLATVTLDETTPGGTPDDNTAATDWVLRTSLANAVAIGETSSPALSNGSVANLFSVNTNGGADGVDTIKQAFSFELRDDRGNLVTTGNKGVETTLKVTAAGTELGALNGDQRTIWLFRVDDKTLVGKIMGANGTGDEYVALKIQLTGTEDNPKFTVTQYLPIEHPTGGSSHDEALSLKFDDRDASLSIKLSVAVTDKDGDVATDSQSVKVIDSTASVVSIEDDGPRISGVTYAQLGQDLVVNGSFEDGHNIGQGQWEIFGHITGWRSGNGIPFEIQGSNAGGVAAVDGKALVELDSDFTGNGAPQNDGYPNGEYTNALIEQQVMGTKAGETYELTFWYAPRGDASTAGMKVMFGGETVFLSSSLENTPNVWQKVTITVNAPTDNAVLSFYGLGTNDEMGALLDNVSLRTMIGLDDDSQTGGNPGGPGDDASGTSISGKIDFDAGTDHLKAIVFSKTVDVDAIWVDAKTGIGYRTDVKVDWVADGAGGKLVGTMERGGETRSVFELVVDKDGNFKVTMSAPLAHPYFDADGKNDGPQAKWEDNLAIKFDYKIVDNDGDEAHGQLQLNVDDDTPVFFGNPDNGTVLTLGSMVEGDLNLSFGADGQNAYRGLTIGNYRDINGVTETLSADGRTLTAKVGDTEIYKLELVRHDDGSYGYKFTQSARIPTGTGLGYLDSLHFGLTVKDGDGDSEYADFNVTLRGNSTPTIEVITPNGGNGHVSESALPTGSDPQSTAEATSGSIKVGDADGLGDIVSLTIDGGGQGSSTASLAGMVGQTIEGLYGSLKITGLTDGVLSYTYTLHTASTDVPNAAETDVFSISVTDGLASAATTITIEINDDVPTAKPDSAYVIEDGLSAVSGNVLDNDVGGADAPKAFVSWSSADATAIAALNTYGTLVQGADGTWSFTLDNSRAATQALKAGDALNYTLHYTMKDGDGDTSSSELKITVKGADDGVTITGLSGAAAEETVYENDLPNGSSPDAAALTQTGSFAIDAKDGLASIKIGGQTFSFAQLSASGTTNLVVTGDHGTLKITGFSGSVAGGTVSYSYTLTSAVANASGQDQATEAFAVTVTDQDGSNNSGSLDILIVDDKPVLNIVDTPTSVNEGSAINGNWTLVKGADGVSSVEVTVGSETKTLNLGNAANSVDFTLASGKLTVDADGEWHFTAGSVNANQNVTFSVKATDGDHDASSDSHTFVVKDINAALTVKAIVLGTVEEEHGLPGGIEDRNAVGGLDTDTSANANVITNVVSNGTFFSAVTGGAEGTLSYSFASVAANTAVQLVGGGNLTSGGAQVYFALDGGNLVGYTNAGGGAGSFGAGDTKVFTLSLNSASGAYTFTLLAPVDHAKGDNVEGNLSISLNGRVMITDSAGPDVDAKAIDASVVVIDDTPVTGDSSAQAMAGVRPLVNVVLTIDTSGSMGSGTGSRLELAKAAAINLLNNPDVDFGKVMVVEFWEDARINAEGNSTWTSKADAIAFIQSLQSGGSTNYDTALKTVIDNWGAGPGNSAPTLSYFISDGQPTVSNQPGSGWSSSTYDPQNGDGIGDTSLPGDVSRQEWEAFLAAKGIAASYAIGVGDGVATEHLDPIAWEPGNAGSPPVLIDQASDLNLLLNGSLPGNPSGNVFAAGQGFGADGGYVTKVTIEGKDFTYTGGASGKQIVIDSSNVTGFVGKLVFNFAANGLNKAGDWDYFAPTNLAGSKAFNIGYTVVDGDGDTSSSKLHLDVIERTPPSVLDVTVNDTLLTDGDVGAGKFAVTVTFSEAMDTATTPSLSFSPAVGAALVAAGGVWSAGNTVYTATYNVVDTNAQLSNIKIDVNGARDVSGNLQNAYAEQAEFSIDTLTPPKISIGDASVTEGGVLTFTVSLNQASNGPVSVQYGTTNGTASSSDYTAASGTITFAAGQTSQTITVQTKQDSLAELNETVLVKLSSPTNATIADGKGVGTIIDNDALGGNAPQVSVGTSAGSSMGSAYDLTNVGYALSNDGQIDNAATRPSATISGTTSNGEYDYYKLVIAADGTQVVLDVDKTPNSFDPWMKLLSSGGSVLYSNDDRGVSDAGSSGTQDSYLNVTLDAGTYYVQLGAYVSGFLTSGFGAPKGSYGYELQVSIIPSSAADPIVLDLDGNGHAFTAVTSGVSFDLDGDGHKDQVAWSNGGDGMLAFDANGNGVIDNGTELFTPWFRGGNFANGAAALASLDSNGDGVIDAKDAEFGKLAVWQDANGDGVTDAGELKSLSDHGIASVSTTTAASGAEVDGQSVVGEGSFTRTDGSTGGYVEVHFDTVFGTAGQDANPGETIVGTDGNDFLTGTDGDDIIIGGLGNDTLVGGAGADTFVFAEKGDGNVDTIKDYVFDDGDAIDLTALLDHNVVAEQGIQSQVTVTNVDAGVEISVGGEAVAVLDHHADFGSQIKILVDGHDYKVEI